MTAIDKTNLTDQTKFRLNEISKTENYVNQKISQRNSFSKKLSKYVAAFDHIDKILIVLSATSGGVCLIPSVSVAETPVGKAGASLTLIFPIATGIIKTLLNIARNKKKKHDKILKHGNFSTWPLIDMEISHEEFITILKEKDKYEKMKENVRNVNEKQNKIIWD